MKTNGRHAAPRISMASRWVNIAIALVVALLSSSLTFLTAFALGPSTLNNSTCDLASSGYAGSGTALDPWQISDSSSLWEVTDCEVQNPGSHYALIADINASPTLSPFATKPIGHLSLNTFNKFKGTLDGRGKTIFDARIFGATSNTASLGIKQTGLFAAFENAKVKDLNLQIQLIGVGEAPEPLSATGGLAALSTGMVELSNISVSANIYASVRAGAIIGSVESASVSNVSIFGQVTGFFSYGSIFGEVSDSAVIRNSNNYAAILSDMRADNGTAGGFVGYANNLQVFDSTNSGTVRGQFEIGGFIGRAVNASISGSVNLGRVIGGLTVSSNNTQTNSTGIYLGGIVGYVDRAQIVRSSNNGAVGSFGSVAGGLVGLSAVSATVEESRNLGEVAVTGTIAAGLVGVGQVVAIANSYNSGKIVARNHIGGLVGKSQGDTRITTSINIGSLDVLTGPGASAVIDSIVAIDPQNSVSVLHRDGLVTFGSFSHTHSFTIAPSSRSGTSDTTQLSNRDTFTTWNFDSIWGFDCSPGQVGPRLRVFYAAGALSSASCPVVVPTWNQGGDNIPRYFGPEVIGKYQTSAGLSVSIAGNKLDQVQQLWIGTYSATISSVSYATLTLTLSSVIPTGIFDVTLLSSHGRFVAIGVLEVLPTPTVSKSLLIGKTFRLPAFSGQSSKLNANQTRYLLKLISGEVIGKVVCTAPVRPSMRASTKSALRRQAAAVCGFLESNFKNLDGYSQIRPASIRGIGGRVLITVRG